MTDITKIDHKALAVSRLATQYRESQNLINFVKALVDEENDIDQLLIDVVTSRYLDQATGYQLDVIGKLVGQSRILIAAELIQHFGFDGYPGALGFGDLDDPSVGGRLISLGEAEFGNRLLTDDEYRFFIETRIIKNYLIPTIPNIIDFYKALFNAPVVNLQEGYMYYIVQIGRLLTSDEKVFLNNTDLVPKIACFKVSYSEFDSEDYFGFDEDVGAKGFADLDVPGSGGTLASLI